MRATNSETAAGAAFTRTTVPDLHNLLNALARGVAASTQEGAIR